jgi:hypothetical protein
MEEIGSVLINVICRFSCGGAEGKLDKPQSEQPIARRMVKSGTSQTQFCNFTTKRRCEKIAIRRKQDKNRSVSMVQIL